jgi:hypothetical protein
MYGVLVHRLPVAGWVPGMLSPCQVAGLLMVGLAYPGLFISVVQSASRHGGG